MATIPPLTPLERIGPKAYLRYIFPFTLPASSTISEISTILQAGYDALTSRLPIIACEGIPDVDATQAGVLKLVAIPPNDEISRIVIKDLTSPGAFPLSYSDLKAKNFPLSVFNGEILCRRALWPEQGDRLPVSLVQANFINGGVILTWCIFHAFGDGNTFLTWTKIWAEECRRAAGEEVLEPLRLDPAMFGDREKVMRSSGRNPGRMEDHPEYTLLPFTPTGPPPKMTSASHVGQVFYFSKEKLKELKEQAAPGNAKREGGQEWISTNDALSALLWRTVMAVQYPLERLEGNPVSVLNIAIDGRLRTDPPVHPSTVGCFLEYVAVSERIREMLDGSLGLADLAIVIRKALVKADKQFTDDVAALVEGLEDVDRLVATAFLDVPGYNCVQTSWVNFELYGLNWGEKLGGAIQAVRAPSVGVLNGLQVVLPVLPDGGMEIIVGVEGSCLERLLSEPLWVRFAEAR